VDILGPEIRSSEQYPGGDLVCCPPHCHMSDELLLFLDIAGITLEPNIGRNVEGEVKYSKILSEEGFLNTEVRSRYFTTGNGLRLYQIVRNG
jgi:hypothetical protein